MVQTCAHMMANTALDGSSDRQTVQSSSSRPGLCGISVPRRILDFIRCMASLWVRDQDDASTQRAYCGTQGLRAEIWQAQVCKYVRGSMQGELTYALAFRRPSQVCATLPCFVSTSEKSGPLRQTPCIQVPISHAQQTTAFIFPQRVLVPCIEALRKSPNDT